MRKAATNALAVNGDRDTICGQLKSSGHEIWLYDLRLAVR